MDLPQIKKNEETKEYNIINYSGDESKMNYLNLMRGIDNLPEENSNYNPHVITNHKAPGHTDRMYNRIKSIKPGENMKKAYERLVSEGKEEFAKQNFPESKDTRKGVFRQVINIRNYFYYPDAARKIEQLIIDEKPDILYGNRG